jgi:hypothetical protein
VRAALRLTWLAAIAVINVVPVSAAGPIQMRRIELIPAPATRITSTPQGFDLDHDSRPEFIIRVQGGTQTEFYESIGDDTFVLAHVIVPDGESNRLLMDAGDIDADGLSDLVIRVSVPIGGGNVEFSTRVYESESADTYPTELAWDVSHGSSPLWGGLIVDADGDGKQEIVIEDTNGPGESLVIYENDGDDSYAETYFELLPNGASYSHGIADDLDGDGRPEILLGRAISEGSSVIAYESTGDDSYELSWIEEMVPWVAVQFIVDAGDLDGDGRKEFLAGGLKPNAPLQCHLHVFEAIADNEFEIVTTIIQPSAAEGYCDAAVADVDGDGRREIVFSTTWSVTIYENTGFIWSEIWSANWASDAVGPVEQLGAGDHDGDGKDEIIFRQNGWFADTSIWEIHPAYQADMDADDVVDVIDNCPVDFNPGQDDADADTVGDVCDNCIYGFNPAQGAAIFGQQIQALDSETFSWDEPAEVVYARGDLAFVSTYMVDLVQALPLGTSFMDSSVPGISQGFFYLVKPDCGVGSWQTSLGAEPGRDAALP